MKTTFEGPVVKSVAKRRAILLNRYFDIHTYHGHELQDIWGSVALFTRGKPGDIKKANRLLLAWTKLQNRDIMSPWFGTSAVDEEKATYEQGGLCPRPHLYNAFAARALAIIFRRFAKHLQPKVKEECLKTMKMGLFEPLGRDMCLRGHNQNIGMTTTMIIYGTLLDQPAILKKGLYRLIHYMEIGAYLTPMDEYNSPTYAVADLTKLAAVLEVTRRPDVRTIARVAMERLLLVLACHYHRATHELAPPHYRAYYGAIAKYAGGVGPIIFRITGDQNLVNNVTSGLHDAQGSLMASLLDFGSSDTLRRLFLKKPPGFEVKETVRYHYPNLPGQVNDWPEINEFYPDHQQREARIRVAGHILFDHAVPKNIASTYMTSIYTLGSFSNNSLSSPYGYARFHTRGLQFYYRPRRDSRPFPARWGFLAFPNAGKKGTPDNIVKCESHAGQYRNIALALYTMEPKRTDRCEVFCPLPAADGQEEFHDAQGLLKRGKNACGPLFMRDGEAFLAFFAPDKGRFRVEDHPAGCRYFVDPIYHKKRIPVVTLSHYRGAVRSFKSGTRFAGGIAVVLGDKDQYGNFENFRKIFAQANLSFVERSTVSTLTLSGVKPLLRLKLVKGLSPSVNPQLFVGGKPQKSDTLSSPLARQSMRGKPLKVGVFRVESNGKPVTAYASAEGSGCVLLQPLPVPIDVCISMPGGKIAIRDLTLGRAELTLSPLKLVVETCARPQEIRTSGRFKHCQINLRTRDPLSV